MFMRLPNSYIIKMYGNVDCHPITGNADPTSLVALPPRYKSYFISRNNIALSKALEKDK